MGSKGNHQHGAVFSPSLIDETIAIKRQQLNGTLTSPSLPTLPFDLIQDILYGLLVKSLIQFRCVCKSWNSLISDPKFTKKHLHLSTTRLVHTSTYSNLRDKQTFKSYPLHSVFTNVTTNHIAHPITLLEIPSIHFVYFVGSCNGILCILANNYAGFVTVRLWNPSIRKFKVCPYLEKQQRVMMYGFGYDIVTNNYKVVVDLRARDSSGNFVDEMKVFTLGTDSWKSIQKFPYGCVASQPSGKFVSGTINWLVSKKYGKKIIVSLDLGSESYKNVLLPDDYGVVYGYIYLHLDVLKDCLCMVFGHDVWVMKEHGNKDSWTKLFTISYMQDLPTPNAAIKVIQFFDDGQVLLKSKVDRIWKLIFYNSRNGTFKFTEFENMVAVCIESLISPCS